MPARETIEVYTFEELPDAAKEKARDWYREGLWEAGFGNEMISDTLESELQQRGLDGLVNDRSPAWSLYVQGSGVSFAGTIDLAGIEPIIGDVPEQAEDEAHIAAIRAAMKGIPADDLKVTVTRVGRDTHDRSFEVEVECYGNHAGCYRDEDSDPCPMDTIGQEDGAEKLAGAIEDWLRDISRFLYRLAEEEATYLESDEAVKEACEANEYLFDVTGAPVHQLLKKAR